MAGARLCRQAGTGRRHLRADATPDPAGRNASVPPQSHCRGPTLRQERRAAGSCPEGIGDGAGPAH
eukprot:967422-Heterocapsa_arctica.AAC.1